MFRVSVRLAHWPLVLAALASSTFALLGATETGFGDTDAQAAPRACMSPGSKTLRQTSQVRVYQRRGVVYGCHFDRNRRYVLGGESTIVDRVTTQQLRVAGSFAGYNVLSEGRDGVSSLLIVKDLRSGRTVRSFARGGGRCCSGTEQTRITDLVLRSNGSVAWIVDVTAFGDSPSVPPMRITEVRRSDRGSGRLSSVVIDRGPTVDPRSLAIRGATISWRNASQLRAAPLR